VLALRAASVSGLGEEVAMSKTFAIVENGKVINVALSETALADNWIQSDEAQIGWGYDGSNFIAPPEPPEPAPTPEELAVEVRTQRDRLLAASDWTQVADAPVDQAAWATYRQALRDIPQQSGFPENVEWPVDPA
jgi:hypothetical protein